MALDTDGKEIEESGFNGETGDLTPDEEVNFEVKEIVEEEREHFLMEDTDKDTTVCAFCKLQKITVDNKNFVCGTFKARNDFAIKKGYPPIEETFSCSDFKES